MELRLSSQEEEQW